MSERKDVATRVEASPSASSVAAIVPPVDIVENEGGITIMADLPGVSKDALTVRVDGDTLIIEGEAAVAAPQGIELVYSEARVPHYRRRFTLSRELDPSKINAALKDGVLKLQIPKAEEAKPRRIDVKVA